MPRRRIPTILRRLVKARALDLCEYCQYPQEGCYSAFHVDHCVPDGPTSNDNLAWACPTCNTAKQTRTHAIDPLTSRLAPLFNPRSDRWNEHFTWSPDLARVVGLTPIGRATAAALRMNRREALLLRAVLAKVNLHPAQS